jgi:hypothetical protein
MPDRVRDACEAYFEAIRGDSSGFVRAVAASLGIELTGSADDIVQTIRNGGAWTRLHDGMAAAQSAAAGKFVVVGLLGSEQAPPIRMVMLRLWWMASWRMEPTQRRIGVA